jgi:enoyl-CoA hydratase/carnithine racemase
LDVIETLTPQTFVDRIRFDRSSLSMSGGVSGVVVDFLAPNAEQILGELSAEELVDLSTICIGLGCIGPGSVSPVTAMFDLVLDDAEILETIISTITEFPLASVATAVLMRGVEHRSVIDSLVAESTTYSMLQAGPEFRHWQATRPKRDSRRSSDLPGDLVVVERDGANLLITLNQPDRCNAYSSAMRSALGDALEVAVFDPSVESVTLRGAGKNFSSGGDLDEFGLFSDPVTAHFSRLSSRVMHYLWTLRQRLGTQLLCVVHGENYGAGVELAAFAGRVNASRHATFTLPELRMGLIPGAGGTASLPLRIGRQRTMLLALTGLALDAETAQAWGLVDEILPDEIPPGEIALSD